MLSSFSCASSPSVCLLWRNVYLGLPPIFGLGCLFVFVFVFFLEIHVLLFIYLFIYLFMTVLSLRFCARALSSCGKWGPLPIAVRGPLTIAASPVAEHRLQTRKLSNCGPRSQLLRGTRDLPRRGLEPVSPALAGRFSTTVPPGKPRVVCFLILSCISCLYILEINPLSIASFANIFSHSEGCLFFLFMVSFAVRKLLSLIRSHVFIFVFIFITLGGGSKKILLWFMSKSVLPVFSSKSFIVSGLIPLVT